MLKTIICILIAVESGNDWNVIGDDGRAWGGLQIQAAVVEDVNRIYGTRYRHKHTFVEHHARNICRLYLLHWVGPDGTAEEYARTWNGGPRGMQKASTLKYWEKVSNLILTYETQYAKRVSVE